MASSASWPGLLLPALSTAKQKAAQAYCLNNVKQLGIGMMLYLGDNQAVYPGLASRRNGYHPEDWIYWRVDDRLTPPVEKSPIVSLLGSANPALFRCPMDKDDRDRLGYNYGDDEGIYPYSYSLTGYGMGGGNSGLSGNTNYGMSSIFQGDIQHPTAIPVQGNQRPQSDAQNHAGRGAGFAQQPRCSHAGATLRRPS